MSFCVLWIWCFLITDADRSWSLARLSLCRVQVTRPHLPRSIHHSCNLTVFLIPVMSPAEGDGARLHVHSCNNSPGADLIFHLSEGDNVMVGQIEYRDSDPFRFTPT